jgi:hypothetical protein
MKPGLLDICANFLSLGMAMILAFDVVARFNCADFRNGQAGRERQKRDRRA